MTAEKYQHSLVNSHFVEPAALPIPQGYYRSKLFTAPFSKNGLIAAAGPLLSLLERLCLSASLPPLNQIRDNIEHELLAFNSKLNASQYPATLIQVAYYLMAATIDEVLGKSYLRVYQTTPEFQAFTPLTANHTSPQERFFEIVQYIKERPNQYLDLIELVYFFLIAGFEGKYHLQVHGRQALDNYTEELYQIIQHHRFNQPHRLFNDETAPKIVKRNYKAALVVSLVAATVVTLAFFTSHLFLENKAKNVLFGHTQLVLLDN